MQERDYKVRTVAEGFRFLEGPRWHKGALYFSDFYDRAIYRLESDESVTTLCELPDWVSGLGFMPDGDLLYVSVSEHKLYRRSADGSLTEHADLNALVSHNCNDMLVDEAGRAYVGNFGFDVPPTRTVGEIAEGQRARATKLVMVSPEGMASTVDSSLIFPNGMARSRDRRTLLVAETFRGRVSAFDIAEDGSLSGQRPWADFAGRDYASAIEALDADVPLPDGIAMDSEGALWIADAGATAVIRVAEGGEILERISTPGLTSFAVAFGGDDLKTLYMLAGPPFYTHDPLAEKASVLLAARVDVAGVPL
jgi:Gluconolactonase